MAGDTLVAKGGGQKPYCIGLKNELLGKFSSFLFFLKACFYGKKGYGVIFVNIEKTNRIEKHGRS